MAPGDLIPDNHDRSEPASAEVQFALVIARMIDTVRNSPADMRQAVYDLARYKLQEQFTYADAKDIKRTKQALETAIRGVEEFSKQQLNVAPAAPSSGLDQPDIQQSAPPKVVSLLESPPMEQPALFEATPIRSRSSLRWEIVIGAGRSAASSALWPLLKPTTIIITIIVAVLIAFQHRERLVMFTRTFIEHDTQTVSQERPPQAQVDMTSAASERTPVKRMPLRPTDYGVYAVVNDSLNELQLLPGRPPDIRVAVSAALQTPSRTFLAHGHPKFIVFRRDVASNIPDRAEVRIIAKVAREFSVAGAGRKPNDGDDAWIIRNVSFPFRSSPVEGNPEMYELHSEDPALELTPGRYALVVKTQAYDFIVEGEPIDPRQCIERIIASNGTYYTDCKKP
jgi:hypothetical protein